jgi:hypothetical protein
VTHIFGGHGGALVGLVDAIVAHLKLTWVYNRCEVSSDANCVFNETNLGVCSNTTHHIIRLTQLWLQWLMQSFITA